MARRGSLLGLAVAALGCGDPAAPAADAGRGADREPTLDAATDGPTGLPLAGFGELTGDCDVLDTELTLAAPSRFESHLAFARPYTEADLAELSAGGQEMIADGNAGGSSLLSEVFAFEVLGRCELAGLLKTETEIVYDTRSKKTDLLVELDGLKIGVSVTRAVAFPFDQPFSVEQATTLLERKLDDIVLSTASVAAADRWHKQILAVLAYGPDHAVAIAEALDGVAAATASDTIVWVVVSDGADDFIYCDGPCD